MTMAVVCMASYAMQCALQPGVHKLHTDDDLGPFLIAYTGAACPTYIS